jgi:hypothetical protein
MYQNKIVPLVLEAFQAYEKTEPSFQKFVLGVLLQLSANVQCHSQIATQKVLQMCVLDCLNIKEYVRNQHSHKFVLTLRSMAVLYNLSCWESNSSKLLEYGALESIAEILSTNKQSMTELLEASSYFDPLAVATLGNLCRKGACTKYSFPRWQKVIGLAIDSFKGLMKGNLLQNSPPTNICYEFCSINSWDLARSLVALFVNCLTVDPHFSRAFREKWINSEMIDLLLNYAKVVDSEGQILLGFLFCLIVCDSGNGSPENETQQMLLEQIEQSTMKMRGVFPLRFCSYMWMDVSPAQSSFIHSRFPEVQRWSYTFLEASSKTNIKIYRAPKRPLVEDTSTDRSQCEPFQKRKKGSSANLLELEQSLHNSAQQNDATQKDKAMQEVGDDVVF